MAYFLEERGYGDMDVIVANIVIFIGCTLMVITGYIKDEKKMLRVQDGQMVFLAIGNLILKGYSGFIISALALIKNEIYLAKKLNGLVKALIVLVAVVMTFVFNNKGLAGWFPAVTMVAFTYLLGIGGALGFKIVIGVAEIGWAIYDYSCGNYVGTAFDIFTIISCTVGVMRVMKNDRERNKNIHNLV